MEITVPFAYQVRVKASLFHKAAEEIKAKTARVVVQALEANQTNEAAGQ